MSNKNRSLKIGQLSKNSLPVGSKIYFARPAINVFHVDPTTIFPGGATNEKDYLLRSEKVDAIIPSFNILVTNSTFLTPDDMMTLISIKIFLKSSVTKTARTFDLEAGYAVINSSQNLNNFFDTGTTTPLDMIQDEIYSIDITSIFTNIASNQAVGLQIRTAGQPDWSLLGIEIYYDRV